MNFKTLLILTEMVAYVPERVVSLAGSLGLQPFNGRCSTLEKAMTTNPANPIDREDYQAALDRSLEQLTGPAPTRRTQPPIHEQERREKLRLAAEAALRLLGQAKRFHGGYIVTRDDTGNCELDGIVSNLKEALGK